MYLTPGKTAAVVARALRTPLSPSLPSSSSAIFHRDDFFFWVCDIDSFFTATEQHGFHKFSGKNTP
jgi:hypothetical protein